MVTMHIPHIDWNSHYTKGVSCVVCGWFSPHLEKWQYYRSYMRTILAWQRWRHLLECMSGGQGWTQTLRSQSEVWWMPASSVIVTTQPLEMAIGSMSKTTFWLRWPLPREDNFSCHWCILQVDKKSHLYSIDFIGCSYQWTSNIVLQVWFSGDHCHW